ncbi:cupin domain-containing protein [Streptomyces clavuligerus]|uniref:Putative WhiE II protein n=1 Tax=Streptomyces clavuligerus TaxID=1901 RepID=E2PVZ7_STRCL|nr:cupin domain-containing protein [Streptomyces clavuligerus]ANW17512.1 protein in whiE locus [Streptomyces clavuligerus]AXU12057.1 cupin domain-containing protein [Streptomyces clavuligerus]EFG09987.1 putative WhiE II protein [Streptomyces clavuligerus]MBY6301918.1 cupin domain-containing protein [Streptomyces clavuligerus]QCS04838.1 cupin domain-containing protein [Streptomyces clavuligerus]
MTTTGPRIVDLSESRPNTRRGGDLRALLTPTAVGSTSGFMGLAIMQPGERIGEHYHPYSEEFVYVVQGLLEVDLDGVTHPMRPDQGLMIPLNVRHRFRNVGDHEARMVFHLGPLAPRPELGHVDTENTENTENAENTEDTAEPAGGAADSPPQRSGVVS